jgi:hypothetical protein
MVISGRLAENNVAPHFRIKVQAVFYATIIGWLVTDISAVAHTKLCFKSQTNFFIWREQSKLAYPQALTGNGLSSRLP